MTASVTNTILVDSHAHLYDCFNPDRYFNSALLNFKEQAKYINKNETQIYILVRLENIKSFGHHAHTTDSRISGNIFDILSGSILALQEKGSYCFTLPAGDRIFIIPGLQIMTEENLEVLALGTTASYPDGDKIEAVIEQIHKQGAIAVIPWAFGKWSGNRGKIISRLMNIKSSSELIFAENGNRCKYSGDSRLLKRAKEKGFKIISGSDPLPFKSEQNRAGSHGFILHGPFDETHPFASIKKLLTEQQGEIKTFGSGQPAGKFLLNQIRMQLRKLKIPE